MAPALSTGDPAGLLLGAPDSGLPRPLSGELFSPSSSVSQSARSPSTLALAFSRFSPVLVLTTLTPAGLTVTLVPGTEYTGSPTITLLSGALPPVVAGIDIALLELVGYFGLLGLMGVGYFGLLGSVGDGYSGLLGLVGDGYSGLLGLGGVGYLGLPGSGPSPPMTFMLSRSTPGIPLPSTLTARRVLNRNSFVLASL